jgi:beta-phosphoglucomutase
MKPSPISFTKVPVLSELKQGFPGLKGLFFDMDGTLFNTESYHAEALLMIGSKYKIRPPHSPETVHDLMIGKADHLVYEIVKDWEGFPKHWTVKDFVLEKNLNLINILENKDPTDYFPKEVLNLLEEARNDKLFLALVTSSEKVITTKLLQLAKLTNYFELILTRDDCPTHKPDPWPYLKAQEISQLSKNEIIIFEDSDVGLSAAMALGSHVIKVEWF